MKLSIYWLSYYSMCSKTLSDNIWGSKWGYDIFIFSYSFRAQYTNQKYITLDKDNCKFSVGISSGSTYSSIFEASMLESINTDHKPGSLYWMNSSSALHNFWSLFSWYETTKIRGTLLSFCIAVLPSTPSLTPAPHSLKFSALFVSQRREDLGCLSRHIAPNYFLSFWRAPKLPWRH